jgi:hypothetical protein
MRMNVRYSRDREFGADPWNEMKMSCAISSRRVIGFIQRLTVADALMGGGAGATLGAGLAGGLAARAAE